MKALIMRDDIEAAAASAQALMAKGFQVACVENRHIVRALLRVEPVDLLVMDERVAGRLTHALALSAERRYPYINTILMTDRPGSDADELYGLIPSLYALAGTAVSPDILARLALSSIEDFAQAEARVGRLTAVDLVEAALADDPMMQDDVDDWSQALADDACSVVDEGAEVLRYRDVAYDTPADPECDADAEAFLDDDFADQARVSRFASSAGSDAKSVAHIATVNRVAEVRPTV